MNRGWKNILSIGLVAVSMMAVGCSSKKSSSSSPNNGLGGRSGNTTDDSTTVGTPPNDSSWGAKAYLDFVDNNAFEDFSGYYADDLQNERVYLKLYEVVDGSNKYYEGEIRLAYDRVYTHGSFSSTPGKVEMIYKHPRFEAEQYSQEELEKLRQTSSSLGLTRPAQGVRFNKFYTRAGKEFFVGFFEEPDFYDFSPWDQNLKVGALMVVIDGLDDSGFSGSVWYKNYRYTTGTKTPHLRCWEIKHLNHPDQTAPYDCRGFLYQNQTVRPDLVSSPGNGYRKLGEFYNLDPDKAFGN